MKRIGWPLLAFSSLLLALSSGAATRPHYGGTLRVMLHAAPTSLDPVEDSDAASTETRAQLARLIFDTLTTVDSQGRVQPWLALSWESEAGGQRWRFKLRPGVHFQGGSAVTADSVVAALRTAHANWNVHASGDTVIVESDEAMPGLNAELSLPRNAIVRRDGGKLVGTGAFHVGEWQPGKKLTLMAEDNYWNGRPYLDAIEMELGRSARDQAIALELGKADVIEISADQIRRATSAGLRVSTSAPTELLALVFLRAPASPEEERVREALGFTLDRASLQSVLMQGQGDVAGGLLPNWMSGYAFLFSTAPQAERARQLLGQQRQQATLSLGYDAADPLSRVVAERIALNAREAGIVIQLGNTTPDVRLVSLPLLSPDPRLALVTLADEVGAVQPHGNGGSVEDLYRSEKELLDTQRIIPLLHLPLGYGLGLNLRNWELGRDGTWSLGNLWLDTGKH